MMMTNNHAIDHFNTVLGPITYAIQVKPIESSAKLRSLLAYYICSANRVPLKYYYYQSIKPRVINLLNHVKWIEVQGELHGGGGRSRYGRRLIANCSAKISFVVTLSEMSLRHCHLVITQRASYD